MNVAFPVKGMIAVAAAVPALVLGGLPAGATTASLGVVNVAAPANGAHAKIAPNDIPPEVKIIHSQTGALIFTPVTVQGGWSAPTQQTCTTNLESVVVTNRSGQPQDLLYNGQFLETLPKATSAGLCFFGSGVFAFRFNLTGSTSTLKVAVS